MLWYIRTIDMYCVWTCERAYVCMASVKPKPRLVSYENATDWKTPYENNNTRKMLDKYTLHTQIEIHWPYRLCAIRNHESIFVNSHKKHYKQHQHSQLLHSWFLFSSLNMRSLSSIRLLCDDCDGGVVCIFVCWFVHCIVFANKGLFLGF